jgi:hypothetical protein
VRAGRAHAKPIRFTRNLQITDKTDELTKVNYLTETLTQFSGIAVRKQYAYASRISHLYFVEFTAMVLPLIFEHRVGVLDKPNVAIRSAESGSQKRLAYTYPPSETWINLIRKSCPKTELAEQLINKFVRQNYVGLVSLKAYAGTDLFFRELKYMDKSHLKFYLYVIPLIFIPSTLLRYVIERVKQYKERRADDYMH